MAAEPLNAVQDDVEQVASTVEHDKTDQIIRNHTLWSAGMGLIPVPMLDIAGIAGMQYSMVSELAKVYNIPFSKERVRAIVAALVGGSLPAFVAGSGVGSLAKAVPLIGTLLGAAVMPALAAAATIALGRVFVQHFEAGGTLLDFDPDKMKAYFNDEFERARGEAGDTLANAGKSPLTTDSTAKVDLPVKKDKAPVTPATV